MSNDPSLHKRVILHVDLDAFYVACERELNPLVLLGRPVAVSQYNPHGDLKETKASDIDKRLIVRGKEEEYRGDVKGDGSALSSDGRNGSMIAVSYEARAAGVKRGDRGYDAVQKCPSLCIVQVPVKRGKADLTMYRSASRRIIDVLIESFLSPIAVEGVSNVCSIARADLLVEKASIDEIYIDLTVAVDKIVSYMDHRCTQEERRKFWDQILYFGRDIGATSIGGVEILSSVAKAANELSKDEVRRGASCQIMEKQLDSASTTWWNRSLEDNWTEMEIRLAIGAYLAAQARESVRNKFKTNDADVFTLSGGISSNKTLAKLASGLKKPNRQTIINATDEVALKQLFHPLKLNRIRGLGGKFGESVSSTLNIETVGDLAMIPLTKLKSSFPSTDDEKPIADFLYDISRGNCVELVKERTLEKSMSSGKTFRKNLAIPIKNNAVVKKWLGELSAGLLERLEIDFEDNARIPSLIVLSIRLRDTKTISRSTKAPSNLSEDLYKSTVFHLFESHFSDQDGYIEGMTITGTNFQEVAQGRSTIADAFKRVVETCSDSKKERMKSPIRKQLFQKPKRTIETLWNNIQSQSGDQINENKNSPSSKRIRKDSSTGMMSDLKEGQIDKTILSSLPPSIQSEIRIAEMSKIGSMNQNKRCTEASKRGCIDTFFQPKSKCTTAVSERQNDRPLKHPPSSHGTTLTRDDIDPSVLAELPFHIQAMIKKEIRQSKMQR